MEFDDHGRPFIQLPSPYDNIRLTPPRYKDGPENIKCHNDPRIYMNLHSPPYPYTTQSWDEWWPIVSKTCANALSEFKELQEGKRKWVGSGCPCVVIRDMSLEGGDGMGRFIGDISLRKSDFAVVVDAEEKRRRKDVNAGYEDGDERCEWETGFYLSRDAHGRGIMPVALKTLIEKFGVPYMNVHNVIGTFYEHNIASRRVFEKNGFVFEGITPEVEEIAESKGGVKGQKLAMGLVRWTRERKTE